MVKIRFSTLGSNNETVVFNDNDLDNLSIAIDKFLQSKKQEPQRRCKEVQ